MRYIIGLLVTIGLIVLIFVLLLRGSGGGPTIKPLHLEAYAGTDNTVQLITDGPIIANQNHNEAQIIVGNDEVTFNLYQGYNQQLVKTQTYPNNQSSYAVFLHALTNYGFTKGNSDPKLSDERGKCALGSRHIYIAQKADGTDAERFWSTTCGGGTFGGNASVIISLFQKQVPDYFTLTNNATL